MFPYTKHLFLSFFICENKYMTQKHGTFQFSKNNFPLLPHEIKVHLSRYSQEISNFLIF